MRNGIARCPYGPIIPADQNERLKRYTREGGEFELAFGREPESGDVLRLEHVACMHSSENHSREFGRVIKAWQRQLPQLTCPLKFEGGRLLRRLAPRKQSEAPKWEEDVRIEPEFRWLEIPEVFVNTDFETMRTIPAVTFVGVVGAKHQCRPTTHEELGKAQSESPIKKPAAFMFGRQRFRELMVEVMGV